MKNKILIISVLILLALPLVLAEEQAFGTFKRSNVINLIQICANCSSSNISSITYQNSSNLTTDQVMTKRGTEFNYSISYLLTNNLGKYVVRGIADPNGVEVIWISNFEVTQTGHNQTTAQGITSAIIFISVLVLTFLFVFMGFKLFDSDLLWILGFFFIIFSLFLAVYDVWLGYEYYLNFSGSNNTSGVPQTIFIIFLTILGVGVSGAFVLFLTKWEVFINKVKALLRELKKAEGDDSDDWNDGKY